MFEIIIIKPCAYCCRVWKALGFVSPPAFAQAGRRSTPPPPAVSNPASEDWRTGPLPSEESAEAFLGV